MDKCVSLVLSMVNWELDTLSNFYVNIYFLELHAENSVEGLSALLCMFLIRVLI